MRLVYPHTSERADPSAVVPRLTVLITIQDKLNNPSPDDPFEPDIAVLLKNDKAKFLATAKEWTKKCVIFRLMFGKSLTRLPEDTRHESNASAFTYRRASEEIRKQRGFSGERLRARNMGDNHVQVPSTFPPNVRI